MSRPSSSSQPAATSSPAELTAREEALSRAELEASLDDAQLRGREQGLAAQGQGLADRAAWIESVADQVARWARRHDLELGALLHGLGGGAAQQEADLDAYVQRSATLALARAAMIATREELMARRQAQQQSRRREIDALEAALVRADVRLTAREKLLGAAARQLEQQAIAAGRGAPVVGGLAPAGLGGPAGHNAAGAPAAGSGAAGAASAAAAAGDGAAPASEAVFSPVGRPLRPRLRLGRSRLGRGAIEVDAASRTLLASIEVSPSVGATLELEGDGGDGPLALPVVVRRVLPADAQGRYAVVLAAHGWAAEDWRRLERLVTGL